MSGWGGSGGGRFRLWVSSGALILVALGLWSAWSLLEPGQSGAERANVYALLVAILGILVTVVFWMAQGQRDTAQADLRQLARNVRAQRQAFLDQALGAAMSDTLARVDFGAPTPGQLDTRQENLLVRWRDPEGADEGSLGTLSDLYQGLPNGRMVVLGEPGSGKTVAMTVLTLELIEALPRGDLPQGTRVPVFLSATTWHRKADREDLLAARRDPSYEAWLIEQLGPLGITSQRAKSLVEGDWILPIIDGVDEMASSSSETTPGQLALLEVLNSSPRGPVVLASRIKDYAELSEASPESVVQPLLIHARHISLQSLTSNSIIEYLRARLDTHQGSLPPQWEPVISALNSGLGAVGEVLATPLFLLLGIGAVADGEADPQAWVVMEADELRRTLIASYIPAVTSGSSNAWLAARGWTQKDVEQWLRAIGRHQLDQKDRGWPETDIVIPELWCIGGHRWPRWILPIAIVASWATLFIVSHTAMFVRSPTMLETLGMIGVGILFVGMAVEVANKPSRVRRHDFRFLTTRRGRRWLMSELGIDLALLLVFTLGFVLILGFRPGLGLALFLLPFVTLVALDDGVAMSPSPSALVRQGIRYCATTLLAFTLAFTLALWLVSALWIAPLVGLGFALWIGLLIPDTHVWVRYGCGVWAARRQNLLPSRPAVFLDWCVSVGLMRMSGTVVQFRHRILQDYLAEPRPGEKASQGQH